MDGEGTQTDHPQCDDLLPPSIPFYFFFKRFFLKTCSKKQLLQKQQHVASTRLCARLWVCVFVFLLPSYSIRGDRLEKPPASAHHNQGAEFRGASFLGQTPDGQLTACVKLACSLIVTKKENYLLCSYLLWPLCLLVPCYMNDLLLPPWILLPCCLCCSMVNCSCKALGPSPNAHLPVPLPVKLILNLYAVRKLKASIGRLLTHNILNGLPVYY